MAALVKKIWQDRTGALLLLYLALDWVPSVNAWATGGSQAGPFGRFLVWFAVDAFLVWRIWRGGKNSWAILLVLTVFSVILILIGAVWPWSPPIYLQAAAATAQLSLLLSPAVRRHLQTGRRVSVIRRP